MNRLVWAMEQDKAILAAAGLATGLVGVVTLLCYRSASLWHGAPSAVSRDPGLLVKGTSFERYETALGHVYPKIRTFYHEHPQAAKLPHDLPLLVFIHGLGGSAAQFSLLLTSLVNVAPCLAIDLPGCGGSDFEPREDEAYTTTAFAGLLAAAVHRFRNKEVDQKVVLFGHSMGCSIAALLASAASPLAHLCAQHVRGVIAICPRSTVPSDEHLRSIRLLQWIWPPLFDLLRMYDRIGGINSASVLRVAGEAADSETRKLQLRFNEQSNSTVFLKFLKGVYLQETATRAKDQESLLGQRVWAGVQLPLFLIAAKGDRLAPPNEAEKIADWLQTPKESLTDKENTTRHDSTVTRHGERDRNVLEEQAERGPEPCVPATAGDMQLAQERLSQAIPPRLTNQSGLAPCKEDDRTSTERLSFLQTSIFPEQASHGLLYHQKDARILCSLIEHFLGERVDERLLPRWQLSHLTTSGKWDVKNVKKWQSVDACSPPIGGIFRAMKTMREIDDVHNPREFVHKYGYGAKADGVAMVVDISHDVPVYNKEGLEDGGVEYHKFPTVSKQAPTYDEVEKFIRIIDGIRRSPKISNVDADKPHPTIGLHCHYGFNRCGFFITAYLVEREKWTLEDAIDEFARKRKPGIKHEHFINELYARYAGRTEKKNRSEDNTPSVWGIQQCIQRLMAQ